MRSGEWAKKQKRMRERTTGLGRRTKEEIEKWDKTDSTEIPDGGDIRNPQPPFGGGEMKLKVVLSWQVLILSS